MADLFRCDSLTRRAALVFCCAASLLYSSVTGGQTLLRVRKESGAKMRTTDIYPHTIIRYKTARGGYRKGELLAMKDTLLLFRSLDTVYFSEIRGIRIPNYRHSLKPIQNKLFYAALLLIPLALTNQLITGRDPHVTGPLLIVAGSLAATSMILGYFRTKRIRIGKNTSLQVLDYDYQHMNSNPATGGGQQ